MPRFHRFPIFFAPETDTAAAPPVDVGTGDISVPMVPPTPREVHDVVLPGNDNLENAPILKDLPKETRKVRGPTDFGMPSADESAEEMGLIPKRERGPDGKFLPKQPNTSPSTQQPKPKATTPPAAKVPTPTAQPVKTAQPAAAATPAPVAKVKIGNQEKTEAEWAQHFAELEAKANPKTPEPPKAPELPAKTEAETAAETQARETKFLTERAKEYTPSEQDLDKILVGGPEAAAHLGTLIARAELRGRQFGADQVNKLAEHYDTILKPILDQNQTVQGLMQEAAFLGAHPDIKANPKGLETFRQLKSTMESGRKTITDMIAAGTASRRQQLWAEEYDETTPDKLMEDLAGLTRAELAKLTPVPASTPAPAKPAQPQVKPNPANERPLSGDRPGGANSAPRGETTEQRIAREVNASKGIHV